jgi:formylglycine-generating enzyme required for sulfatase activity
MTTATATCLSTYNLVKIKGGSFVMGDADGTGQAHERPASAVTVSDYYLGRYCVTVREYYDFIVDPDGGFQEQWCEYIDPTFILKSGDRFEIAAGAEDYPMHEVNYYGAVAYCNWCSLRQGFDYIYDLRTLDADLSKSGFRLPTEAEWEYACVPAATDQGVEETVNFVAYDGAHKTLRAAARNIGGFGCRFVPSNKDAQGTPGIESSRYASPLPVGTLTPNQFGLYEMLGNVNEWCQDRYGSYTNERKQNPCGPAKGTIRAVRGGHFADALTNLRRSYRSGVHPEAKCEVLGFRIALNSV